MLREKHDEKELEMPIGIILCKSKDKLVAEYAINFYSPT